MPDTVERRKGRPFTVRLATGIERWIAEESSHSKRPRSAVLGDLLEEAIQTRRFPGIAFRGPAHDRRAWLIGSSLDVWEAIEAYREVGAERFHEEGELSPAQADVALRYYEHYSEEIDRVIAENSRTEDDWHDRYPTIVPAGR